MTPSRKRTIEMEGLAATLPLQARKTGRKTS
jgi:hypothetical protein